MVTSSSRPVCLKGYVWNDNSAQRKTILIDAGVVVKIYDNDIQLPDIPNLTVIDLKDDEVMFPCLINLHAHIGYNILPIWETISTWKNRFQWRNNDDYKKEIKGLIEYIKTNWQTDIADGFASEFVSTFLVSENKEAFASLADNAFMLALSEIDKVHAILSEIQAVAGGTGLIQQTLKLDDETPDNRTFVIRNTGNPTDLNIQPNLKVAAIVDFYKPDAVVTGKPDQDTSIWSPVKQNYYDNFVNSVNAENAFFYSTIVHVGEGKTGYFQKGNKDKYSFNELSKFFKDITTDLRDLKSLEKANLSITHANGFDYADKKTLNFLKDHNISIIWSPVSNLLLYEDTLPIKILLDNGINVCLGSDWSPSGSKHVLDELKFASFLSDHLKLGIPPRNLFDMASVNPAKSLGGVKMGELKVGGSADLFVLKKDRVTADPLSSLLSQDDSAIQFVMVNGRVVYGNKEIFDTILKVDYESFPQSEGQNAFLKGVSLNSTLKFDLVKSLNLIDVLMNRYCSTVINKPDLKRTRFLSSDDSIYCSKISDLKVKVSKMQP